MNTHLFRCAISYLFFIGICLTGSAQSNSCYNGNFETNTFENWEGNYSDIDGWSQDESDTVVGTIATVQGLDGNAIEQENVQVITDNTMIDPYVPGLSPVYPDGGAHSVRLGNFYDHTRRNPQNAVSSISYEFTVPNENFVLTFHYAVVLEDPNDHHQTIERDGETHIYRPFFSTQVIDQSLDTIDCSKYFALADPDYLDDYTHVPVDDDPDDGSIQIPCTGNNGCAQIYYRDWTTVTIPLGDYVGQTLTMQFLASDCKLGGHLGYAYLELACSEPFVKEATLCTAGATVELEAPEGFYSYEWSGTGLNGITDRIVEVSAAGLYQVTLTPQTTAPCPRTFDITVVDSCITLLDTLALCETQANTQTAENVILSDLETQLNDKWNISIQNWYADEAKTIPLDPLSPQDITALQTVYLTAEDEYKSLNQLHLTFNILDIPLVTFGALNAICENASPFTITNITPLGGIFLGTNITQDGLFTVSESGTFDIAYYYENSLACGDTAKQTIEVEKIPTVNAGEDVDICPGDSAYLAAVSSHTTYNWTSTTPLINPSTATPSLLPTSDNTQIILTVTSPLGCTNSDTVFTHFFEKPVLTLPPLAPICKGETVTITANASKTITTWEWFGNTAMLSTTSSSTTITSDTINSSYTVRVVDADGCKTDGNISLIVNPLPIIDAGNTQTICKGQSANLSATFNSNFTYLWSPAATLSNPSIHNPLATPTLEETNYTLQVTDQNGCKASDDVLIRTLENPIPVVNIKYDKDICIGDSIRSTILSSKYLGNNPSYKWIVTDLNGIETTITTQNNALLKDFEDGYSLRLEVNSNEKCLLPGQETAVSNTLFPKVYLYPDLVIEGDTLICYNDALTLSVTDKNNLGVSTYTWQETSGDTTFTVTSNEVKFDSIRSQQSYVVSATNWNCTNTSPVHTFKPVVVQVNVEANRKVILEGTTVGLKATTNASHFTWRAMDDRPLGIPNNQDTTTQMPYKTINYIVDGTLHMCNDADTVLVIVVPPIAAPYLFSPNNDDANDIWIVEDLLAYFETNVKIFNRWGMQVKELTNQVNTWDGNNENGAALPDGVYFYVVNGKAEEVEVSITGYVTIVH